MIFNIVSDFLTKVFFQYLSLTTTFYNHPIVKQSFSHISKIHDWFYVVKREPSFHSSWRNITILYLSDDEETVFFAFLPFMEFFKKWLIPAKWEYVERYSFVDSEDKEFNDFIVRKSYHHKKLHILFTSKQNDLAGSGGYFTKNVFVEDSIIRLPPPYFGHLGNSTISEVKFMRIEYNHPSLKTPVLIDLDKQKFIVGSTILDPVFVFRYLKYHYGNKIRFDLDYTIVVFDEKFAIFEMNYKQSIYLGKNEYKLEFSEMSGVLEKNT